MERMTGLDASFLYFETRTMHMHVVAAIVYDPSTVEGGYSFQKVKDTFAERLHLVPMLRRRLASVPFNVGHPVWGKYGILTLNGGGGYGYVATNGRLALPASGVGVDSFTYTARNGLGVTATTSLTIIVTEQRKNYVGGTADTTIDGLKGHGSVLDGGAGNDVHVSGAAQTVLLGGPGDTLIGGSGPDTFLFPADFGHETIQNFNVHNDRIALQLSVFANFAAVMADTHQLGPNTVIGHDANTITLDNMNLSQLHASQFSFVS